MSGETFNDSFMLEIFRSEVETHVESLTAGLLALERDPGDTSHIDEMMRGAHSIKGAARIVGIDPAVRIAHAMEDGFIAAQNGTLRLQPTHVDSLLRGVDMLNRIAGHSKTPNVNWADLEPELNPLVMEITAILSGHSRSTIEVPAEAASVRIPLPMVLDARAAELARRQLIVALDSGAALVQFDLSGTEDLDATGLALLAIVPDHVRCGRTKVELLGVNTELQRVLEATGVNRLYPAGAC